QGEKELWVTDICGTYSEDLFKKPEPQKMNKKVSSADKNKMDLVDQIKKKIKEKTTFYNEKCKKAKDFLYEYVTAGYNAPQDIIDKFEKMVDKTLSLKNEIKKLTEIKINISKLGVKNTLWVGTKSNGIFTFDSKLKNWTNLDKKNSPLKSNEITTLYREKRYTWIGTADGGLYRYGKYDLTDSSLEPVLIEKGDFSNVFKDGMTLYALKDKSSILIFDALAKKKSWISCDTDDILPDVINDIEIDDQSNLWVATGGNGICVFDGSAWDSFTVESGLPSNDIQKICWLDQSKTLIAASKTGLVGLSDRISTYDGSNWERYDFQTFKSRLDPNGIRYKVVTEKDFIYDNTAAANTPVHSFYKSERSILIGTDAGLYVFSGEKWMKENSLFKKFSSSINQIGDLPNGKILFATLTGSYTHDGVHYGKIPVDTMGQPITSFVRDDQDQQLFWFSSGVFNKFGTLSSYHLGSGEATMKVFKFAVNKIVIIAPYVFMATSKGLYYMRMIM
ncbi:hypothetical protein KAJ27_19230, partial [bacterium]|nr:hypothetical protein [bacterium]